MGANPPSEWYCDSCGGKVTAEDGYLIWDEGGKSSNYDFKIIHQGKCDNKRYISSNALRDFLGTDGQAYLLSFLSYGLIGTTLQPGARPTIRNIDQWVDLFRRLHTPNYEEARRNMALESVLERYSDATETLPYIQRELVRIAEWDD